MGWWVQQGRGCALHAPASPPAPDGHPYHPAPAYRTTCRPSGISAYCSPTMMRSLESAGAGLGQGIVWRLIFWRLVFRTPSRTAQQAHRRLRLQRLHSACATACTGGHTAPDSTRLANWSNDRRVPMILRPSRNCSLGTGQSRLEKGSARGNESLSATHHTQTTRSCRRQRPACVPEYR